MVNRQNPIDVVASVADLRGRVKAWHDDGLTVALVPTMGALHEGHMSLIRMARTMADKVIVSVFVNPTQFGPNEDFEAYPRKPEEDRFKIGMAGGHMVYMPTVGEMYPDGFSTAVEVSGISSGLCGDARPGHFRGVATVVTKLLLQALPDVAIFGEKDYQQLMVIRRMVRDLDIPVRIEGAPVVREMDGLALSSRNAYLSDEERGVANLLYKTLVAAAADMRQGVAVREACGAAVDAIQRLGFGRVDYLELRCAATLEPLQTLDRPARLLVAAYLGRTRLIDNVLVEPAS